jgi:hypothetical protein
VSLRASSVRLAIAVVVLLSCGKSMRDSRPVGPSATLPPAPTPTGQVVAGSSSMVADASGGLVATPGGTLLVTLPAGAVASPTTIKITPIANMARGAAGPAFRLEPEGTVFAVPVTLTFKAPASYAPGTSIADVGVATQDASGFWHEVTPVTRNAGANTVSVTTTHFSDWALTLAMDTAAAEGPITLVQTVGIPFTASGRATIFLQGDDVNDTTYVLTGFLSILDPATGTTTFTVNGASCVPDEATKTLPLSVAEAHKSSPPVFRWGIAASWKLTCTAPGGAVTVVDLPTQFDTLGINLTRCGAGTYGAGQIVSTSQVSGSFVTDCATDGHVYADWNLMACAPGLACSTGVDCRLGTSTCTAGVQACVDAGPAPDGTSCGPAGAYVCSATQCVNPVDPAAAIVVAPTSGLVTTEAGGTASFTVVLGVQPTSDVVVALSSSNTGEGTVAPSSLTFTPSTWNVAQSVTVTGVDDWIADGDRPYTIVTAPAVSVDPRYSGRDASDVSATNLDDDHVGFVVTPLSGLVTTEAGGTATFTVALTSQPTADVTIPLRSSNPAEGAVSPASLTFTAGTWSTPQTVTVTGVDDQVMDGAQAYTILTDPAVSADPGYAGADAPDVAATNLDDDVAGVTVSPTSGLVTTEAGGTATFSIVLRSRPTADVTIPLHSSNTAEGTISPSSVTFAQGAWNVAQTVTVTGVDDLVADGPQTFAVVTDPAVSADPVYAGTDAADVAVTNLDNDVAGVVVTPTTGLVTTEGGGTATFTVVLSSLPTADVTIPLRSSNTAEGTVSPASLTFTTANWSTLQTVTVTGVNDSVQDGPQPYTIITDPAVSTDPAYLGTNALDVSVINLDNDVAGVVVTPTSGLVTTEGGGAATFSVVLATQPTADVTIPLSSSNVAEDVVSPASVVFTPATWNISQVVVVTGQNDFVVDGDQLVTIYTGAAQSLDPVYANTDVADVTVTNLDDDHVGFVVTPLSGLVTTEGGGTATFTVALTSQPTADVTIPLRSSNTAEGTVSPASLTFTAADWSTAQTVTLTGVDDAVVDGPQGYTIITDPAISADPGYGGADAPDVAATNLDNDVAGVVVSPTSGLVTTEGGGTATFTIALRSRPTADVTIPLRSSNTAEGTVSPSSVTFAPAAWNVAQTVTVTGVDDQVADGPQGYTILTDPALSGDPLYAGTDAADVAVTNLDNDVAGVAVTPTAGLVTTEAGGTATFQVALTSQPLADVTVPLRSSNTAEGTVFPSSLTFTSTNWATLQAVTVTGVNDFVQDGPQAYTIITDPAVSTDPAYLGTDAPDVSVTNLDNDVAGVVVTPTSGLITTEAGGADTFSITLATRPTDDVTISLTSSNTGEVTVSPSSVTFTPATWNIPQVVVVTGQDDFIVDGDQLVTIVTGAAVSLDPVYSGTDVADVTVTNQDNDHAGVVVSPTAGLTTASGTTATFSVALTSQPIADVTIPVHSSDPTAGDVSAPSVTLTAADWWVQHVVTITGATTVGPYTIVTDPATSLDPLYAGTDAPDVSVTNQ